MCWYNSIIMVYTTLLCVVYSQLIDVYQFNAFEEDRQGTVKISTSNYTSYEEGFTICLRLKFKVWNSKCIIKSDNFEVLSDSYKYFDGFSMTIGGISDEFKWENPLHYYNEWQSLCFIYNVSNKNVNVALNGNFLKLSVNVRSALGNVSVIPLGSSFKVR